MESQETQAFYESLRPPELNPTRQNCIPYDLISFVREKLDLNLICLLQGAILK